MIHRFFGLWHNAITTLMMMITKSVTFAPRARMAVKASWPGVSKKVTFLPFTDTWACTNVLRDATKFTFCYAVFYESYPNTVAFMVNMSHDRNNRRNGTPSFLHPLQHSSSLQNHSTLDDETIELVCMEFNVECHKEIIIEESDFEEMMNVEEEDEENLVSRPPVVTIMGHVDHGKTTLLDTIRKTHVTEGEFGGITQHIGAYQVSVKGKKVTFLDTPGHEAFTAMRARGAKVTDLVIIVVAADDGVMPQTKEAVDHAKAAGVPVIVAVNKIDKPNANKDRIMNEMSDLGLLPEAWGGDTIFAEVSAKFGDGVSDLLETILVVSEVENFRANPNKMATGTVIEAKLDKGRRTGNNLACTKWYIAYR